MEAKLVRLAMVVCLEEKVQLWGMGQQSSCPSGATPPRVHSRDTLRDSVHELPLGDTIKKVWNVITIN